MGYSKTFLLLGLVFAVVLLISTDVSARELAEAAQTEENVQTDAVEEAKYGHGGYGHGGGHGGYGHGGHGGYGHGGHGGYGHGGHGGHGPPGHGVNVQTDAVEEAKYGYGGGGHGGGHGGHGGHGGYGGGGHGGHHPPAGHGGAGETETNQN